MPASQSLPTTSLRFTVETSAPCDTAWATFSAPGSSLSSANRADASRTLLLTLALGLALGYQLFGQKTSLGHITTQEFLCALDAPSWPAPADLGTLEGDDYFVANA